MDYLQLLDNKAFNGVSGQLNVYPTSDTDTYEATRRTVQLMVRLVQGSRQNYQVLALCQSIWNSRYPLLAKEGSLGIIRACFDWVQNNVEFVNDSALISQNKADRELLIAPSVILAMDHPKGDCDDFSMLIACMISVLGINKVRFVTAGLGDNPLQFSHVYVRAWLPDRDEWVNVDCSHGPYLGWQHPLVQNNRALVAEWEI